MSKITFIQSLQTYKQVFFESIHLQKIVQKDTFYVILMLSYWIIIALIQSLQTVFESNNVAF